MNFDPVSIAEHAVLRAALCAALWISQCFGRLILGWGAVILFCCGAYGWAFLVFVIWCFAENAHRQVMAEFRAGGRYKGRWID